MNFTDAVRQSMDKFLKGKLDLSSIKEVQEGSIKYTPEYFDELEEDLLSMAEEEQDNEG